MWKKTIRELTKWAEAGLVSEFSNSDLIDDTVAEVLRVIRKVVVTLKEFD